MLVVQKPQAGLGALGVLAAVQVVWGARPRAAHSAVGPVVLGVRLRVAHLAAGPEVLAVQGGAPAQAGVAASG